MLKFIKHLFRQRCKSITYPPHFPGRAVIACGESRRRYYLFCTECGSQFCVKARTKDSLTIAETGRRNHGPPGPRPIPAPRPM